MFTKNKIKWDFIYVSTTFERPFSSSIDKGHDTYNGNVSLLIALINRNVNRHGTLSYMISRLRECTSKKRTHTHREDMLILYYIFAHSHRKEVRITLITTPISPSIQAFRSQRNNKRFPTNLLLIIEFFKTTFGFSWYLLACT